MYVDLVFVSLVLLVLIMGNWKKKKEKQIEPRTLCFRGRRANHMLTAALWNRENKP